MNSYDDILIITDLDGTLIPRGQKISVANKQAIARFTAGGGKFAIATGRTPEAATGYAAGININAPSVFFNGSMLFDWQNKEILATIPLSDGDNVFPDFAKVCLENFPNACLEVYTADNCHIISNAANDDPRLPFEYYKYAHTDLAELSDTKKTPWLKFFANDSHENLAELEILAAAAGLDKLANSFYSDTNYYEFVAKNVSKGTMLEKIRERSEFKNTKIIALGDYLNDNEMLIAADCGIATANAHKDTKKAADLVGCAAEDDLIVWTLNHMNEIVDFFV